MKAELKGDVYCYRKRLDRALKGTTQMYLCELLPKLNLAEAVRLARVCNREAVRYSAIASPRRDMIASDYRRERRAIMAHARKLKPKSV